MLPLMRPPLSRSPPDGEPGLGCAGRDANDEGLPDEVHVEAGHLLAVDVGHRGRTTGQEEKREQKPAHQMAHTAFAVDFKANWSLRAYPNETGLLTERWQERGRAPAKQGGKCSACGLCFPTHAQA